jgi:E3 ubiquitin-protein ligase RHF
LTLGRYKDFIAKSTSGWWKRWSEVIRRKVNAKIAAISRMMERLEIKDGTGPSATSASVSGSQETSSCNWEKCSSYKDKYSLSV